jgi:hypothetical protein
MNQVDIDEFWRWFSGAANALANLANGVEDEVLLDELTERVNRLHPALVWEIGRGTFKPMQFVISPNHDPDLRGIASGAVARAPNLPDWEFHATKLPSEDWNYIVNMRTDDGSWVKIDVSGWMFVLLRHSSGAHKVVLGGRGMPRLSEDVRLHVVVLALEAILGEAVMLDRIDALEFVDEIKPQWAAAARSIHQLPGAVAEL